MSSYSFTESHAKEYGVNEAIFLNSVIHWLNKNAIEDRNIQDGRVWTYNTHEEYTKIFSWLSIDQVKRVIAKLNERKVIEVAHFENRNRRSWVTVCETDLLSEEACKSLGDNRQMQEAESPDGTGDSALSHTAESPDEDTGSTHIVPSSKQAAPAHPPAPTREENQERLPAFSSDDDEEQQPGQPPDQNQNRVVEGENHQAPPDPEPDPQQPKDTIYDTETLGDMSPSQIVTAFYDRIKRFKPGPSGFQRDVQRCKDLIEQGYDAGQILEAPQFRSDTVIESFQYLTDAVMRDIYKPETKTPPSEARASINGRYDVSATDAKIEQWDQIKPATKQERETAMEEIRAKLAAGRAKSEVPE